MNTKYPLLWSALCLALGIMLYDAFPSFIMGFLPALPLAGGCFLLLALLWKGKRGIAVLLPILFILFCGMGRMFLADLYWQQQSSWAAGSEGRWQGIVKEAPAVNEKGEVYARYYTELETVTYGDGETKSLSGTAFLYDTEPKTFYRTGDRISVTGKMTAVRIYKNPGKIDLEGRYRSRRLIGRIYPKQKAAVHLEGRSGKYEAARKADEIKEKIAAWFAPYMDSIRLHILMTLLFGGNYGDIPESIMNSFSATGIIHILSVSGSHVALLFGFLYFLGKWLHLPRKLVIGGAVVLVLFYSFLSGLVPPVIRAAVMGILSVGGVFLEREKTSLNLLGAAVAGMLLWDPFYLYDVSFQLSVGASAGILIFYRPLMGELLPLPLLPKWVKEGVALSTAAQVLTIPVMLYDFHTFPLYFIPANLFVTPFLEWVIIAGLLAAAAAPVFLPLAGGILHVSDYLLWAGIHLNLRLSAWPRAALQTGSMTLVQGILYYATVAFLYFKKEITAFRWRTVSALGVWSGLLGLTLFLYVTKPETLVCFPDLGPDQGAILVTGGHKILYYKGGSIPSHTSDWEWKSILGYEGVFDADVLILNLEDVKEPIPLTLPVKVREIWVTGGRVEKKAPWLMEGFEGTLRPLSACRLRLGNLSFLTNGSSWLLSEGDRGVYLSGERGLSDISFPRHTLWAASGRKRGEGIPEEEIDRVQAEVIVYGGSHLASSFEDMDLFEFKNYPAANVYQEGMQTASFRGRWELEGTSWL